MKQLWILSIASLVLTGCGGNDPLNVFNDPDEVPQLALPMPSDQITGIAKYDSTTLGFRFIAPQIAVYAPVAGLVTSVELSNSGYMVSIFFNSHYTVRVAQLASTNRRVGDFVQAGSEVGTNNSSVGTIIRVVVNGAVQCPYSYFTSNGQGRINAKLQVGPTCDTN